MNLQQHENRDDMKIWLSQNEVEQLLEAADDTQQRIAFALGARCGLRSHEVLNVAPEDIVDTDAGTMLRVWHGKGDKFRETPVPRDLATTIRTVDDVRDAPTSLSLVEITSTRSLRRWVRSAADQLYDETGDAGWDHLGFHDLRRTWATALASDDVDPLQPVTGVGGTTSRPSSSIIGELQSRGSATRTPESELALSERSLHMRTEYFLVRFNRPAQ